MSEKDLQELYDVAVPGEWYVSTHVSDSIERINPKDGKPQSIMFMCSIPRGLEKRDYICLENARLIAVMHEAIPGVIKLMEAVAASKDMTSRKRLKELRDTIAKHAAAANKVGEGTWRDADFKKPPPPEEVAVDANASDAEKRRARRKLRKLRRERERANLQSAKA